MVNRANGTRANGHRANGNRTNVVGPIGRVQYLYTIDHAVENIAYHRFQSISVTLLSLTDVYFNTVSSTEMVV